MVSNGFGHSVCASLHSKIRDEFALDRSHEGNDIMV